MDMNYFNSLENKIYETRKSRITASERFKSWDLFFYIINAYYSLFVVVLSIWNLKNPTNNSNSLALLILSVIAFSFTIFVSSLNFKEKSLLFKNNYIALDRLYSELMNIKSNPNGTSDLLEINKKYNDLLENTDNHETIDYYCSLYDDKSKFSSLPADRQALIKKNVINYIAKNIFFKFLLVIAPLLLPLIIKFIDYYILLLN